MTSCKPYTVAIPDDTLTLIQTLVRDFPWHEMPDDGGWEYGTNLDYMKEFCDYWVTEFDWRKQEARINQYSLYPSTALTFISFMRKAAAYEDIRKFVRTLDW